MLARNMLRTKNLTNIVDSVSEDSDADKEKDE